MRDHDAGGLLGRGILEKILLPKKFRIKKIGTKNFFDPKLKKGFEIFANAYIIGVSTCK